MNNTTRPRQRLTRLLLALAGLVVGDLAAAGDRPNILWISCEDMSPNLGCYGDPDAITPNLDQLATEGVRYTRAFAPIGVCAPSRSTIILGTYATTVGTHPMRCAIELPDRLKCFPELLRSAGYYCTNRVKTDYNFRHPPQTWDDSSPRAHWRNRRPGQPFFAVINLTTTHESQIRLAEPRFQERVAALAPSERHDPDRVTLPPYLPDTPEVRKDRARYLDNITVMDREVKAILDELKADGLDRETIVFFFSDHGAGLPRDKRWLYDSSTRVPLIVRVPDPLRDLASAPPGSATDRLVGLIDLGPTVLSLAGVAIPSTVQGIPFLGIASGSPRRYIHGFRDRMDERSDMVRSVRDDRYKYIRNYHPERPWFHDQFVSYMYEMPTMIAWQRLADAGELTGEPAVFMARSKPTEELYDTQADPWEVRNLAADPEHRATLERLRAEHRRWQLETLDLGLLPEADLRSRFGEASAYDSVRRDAATYPIARIAEVADLANRRDPEQITALANASRESDPAVRYWAAVGLGSIAGSEPLCAAHLKPRLADQAAWVRVAAADGLCRLGLAPEALPTLIDALGDPNPWVRLQSIEVLDRLDDAAADALPQLRKALDDPNEYVVRVARHAVRAFGIDAGKESDAVGNRGRTATPRPPQ